jgi:hypothetical protein
MTVENLVEMLKLQMRQRVAAYSGPELLYPGTVMQGGVLLEKTLTFRRST